MKRGLRLIRRNERGRSLEVDAHSEAEVSRIDQAAERGGAGDLAEPVQVLDGAVGVELEIRNIRARIGEMRRVCKVERFGPQLKIDAFRDLERAEQVQI